MSAPARICAVPGCAERRRGGDGSLSRVGWRILREGGRPALAICSFHAEIVDIFTSVSQGEAYRGVSSLLSSVRCELLVAATRSAADRPVVIDREAWRIVASIWSEQIGLDQIGPDPIGPNPIGKRWTTPPMIAMIVGLARRVDELEAALASSIDLHAKIMSSLASLGTGDPPTLLTLALEGLDRVLKSGPRSSMWWRELIDPGVDSGADPGADPGVDLAADPVVDEGSVSNG
jgi:hypothetical protein